MYNVAVKKLERAYEFAKLSLTGKKRYSGEGFEDHGRKCAEILQRFSVRDEDTLVAAILHHSVVDGAATLKDVESEFGVEIAGMLKTLDSLSVLKLGNVGNREFVESLRRMFLALARDLRVVLVKLADILDNLSTLEYLPEDKRVRISQETVELFAPLSERLGMGEMKGQMQDLVFPYLYPEDFKKVKKLLKVNEVKLNHILLKLKLSLERALKEEKIDARIQYRAKHLYSLFNKLKREEINWDINKVYDIVAFRVIVGSVEDCYRALGVVHKLWRPIPDYVRDYIANPKPNGYQSIHTTVLGPGGRPFEIQIRTQAMHEAAEYGVAAHWNYTQAKELGASDKMLTKGVKVSNKLEWVKALAKWQREVEDSEEFLKGVKTDFFGERIFVFTPKGDVKDLPKGATPIDFAYAVHTDLGGRAMGARVNGRMVSLDHGLQNSDVCEILVSKSSKKPNQRWLEFVVTNEARKKIKRANEF